jgi:hypothetical protein
MFVALATPVKTEIGMKWVVAGWLLFIVSALFFIAAAWRTGDMLALAGGIFFLVACFSFLVPIAGKKAH